jgi:hypothetical protein
MITAYRRVIVAGEIRIPHSWHCRFGQSPSPRPQPRSRLSSVRLMSRLGMNSVCSHFRVHHQKMSSRLARSLLFFPEAAEPFTSPRLYPTDSPPNRGGRIPSERRLTLEFHPLAGPFDGLLQEAGFFERGCRTKRCWAWLAPDSLVFQGEPATAVCIPSPLNRKVSHNSFERTDMPRSFKLYLWRQASTMPPSPSLQPPPTLPITSRFWILFRGSHGALVGQGNLTQSAPQKLRKLTLKICNSALRSQC